MKDTIKSKIIINILIVMIIGGLILIFSTSQFLDYNLSKIVANEIGIIISYIDTELNNNYKLNNKITKLDIIDIEEELDIKLLEGGMDNNLIDEKLYKDSKHYALEEVKINIDEHISSDFLIFKDYTDLYEENKVIIDFIIVIGFIFLMVFLFLIYCIITKITQPIYDITDDLKNFGQGKNIREKEYYKDFEEAEVLELADKFYTMRDNILNLKKTNNEFFNKATHELKTPITAIRGYAQIIQSSEGINKAYIKRIDEESKKLNKLVENILLISREQLNRTELKEEVCLNDIIDDILLYFRYKVELENYEINYSYDDEYILSASNDDIHTIFINLIENAFKYSANKVIDIELSMKNEKIYFCIKNNVYDEKKLQSKNLFEPFIKEGIKNNEISSSGLGLYIVKTIVERNKWEIDYILKNDKINFYLDL